MNFDEASRRKVFLFVDTKPRAIVEITKINSSKVKIFLGLKGFDELDGTLFKMA